MKTVHTVSKAVLEGYEKRGTDLSQERRQVGIPGRRVSRVEEDTMKNNVVRSATSHTTSPNSVSTGGKAKRQKP